MPRSTPVILAMLMAFPLLADDTLVSQIANTSIKIPIPAGMVEAPNDPETAKVLADITPTGCVLLRAFLEDKVVHPTKTPGSSDNSMQIGVFALKDVPQDIYSGDFIDLVEKVSETAAHGMLESPNSSFDFEETKNRLDAFQKDTGIALQPDGALYSLGMVSRSGGCVSFMHAQYLTVVEDGKSQRDKCVTVEGYLLLNSKLVCVLTSLMGPTVFSSDILPLKHAAEKFQIALQELNDL
jgi:hypothetical protein